MGKYAEYAEWKATPVFSPKPETYLRYRSLGSREVANTRPQQQLSLHPNMGKRKKKELTQEQIWDDSGLIQSWNDSYEEYKVSMVTFSSEHPSKYAYAITALP